MVIFTSLMKGKKPMPVYSAIRLIGKGRFGAVYEASNQHTNQIVSIKKTKEDRGYKV